MKITFTPLGGVLKHAALLFLLTLIAPGVFAQISLVKWANFFSGPPVLPFSSLAMNDGKALTNGGQSGGGFVSSGQFIANGWTPGNYFQANFSTINYGTNTITFTFGAFEYGAKNFKMQYAVGSTTSFFDFGAAISFPSTGGQNTFTYNLPAACSNQSEVFIRITATSSSNGGGDYLNDFEVKGLAMTAPSITGQPSSTTTCEGADATFSLTASNAITYQWQYRTGSSGAFTNVPSNATYDNETTAALTINDVTTAMSGYQYQCVVTGGTTPNATSNIVTLTVNAYGTWNGSVNGNWNNASNWNCGQVPSATTNVTITTAGTPPVVNVNNAVCNNLTINTGATLAFTGTGNQLDIKGTVSGSGTLNASAGKVIFSGASAQSVPAATYKDLQLNGSGAKTLAGNISVTGALTLTLGTLTLGSSNLTLTATGTNSGANANSFIVTNGTGALINQGIGSGGKTGNINFPVGATASAYTPLVLNNTTGTSDNFTVQVKDGVFSSYSGTTGSGAVTGNAVNKTWFVSEGTPGGSNATLQLTWNGTNELPGFFRDNCALSHYTGGSWQGGNPTFAVGPDPYTVSRPGITSFSPFGVGSSGSPLPLNLIAFYGNRTAEGTLLSWTTVNEQALLHFDIERSLDGKTFTKCGNVAARNQRQESKYSFTDKEQPTAAGVVYYRLKINEESGKDQYSEVIRIGSGAEADQPYLYPNPVSDQLYIRTGTPGSLQVKVLDITGKQVMDRVFAAGQGLMSLSVKDLPAGNYILEIQSPETGSRSRTKFAKQ